MSKSITKSIIVKGTPSELYHIWADFTQFPRFMENIESVKVTSPGRSHWIMRGPLNYKLEWDAEVTRHEPGQRIAWRSIDDETSDTNLKTNGQVTFMELPNNETEITVTMMYIPPAGAVGEIAAQLFDNPEERLTEDLRRFKSYAERGAEPYPSMPGASRSTF